MVWWIWSGLLTKDQVYNEVEEEWSTALCFSSVCLLCCSDNCYEWSMSGPVSVVWDGHFSSSASSPSPSWISSISFLLSPRNLYSRIIFPPSLQFKSLSRLLARSSCSTHLFWLSPHKEHQRSLKLSSVLQFYKVCLDLWHFSCQHHHLQLQTVHDHGPSLANCSYMQEKNIPFPAKSWHFKILKNDVLNFGSMYPYNFLSLQPPTKE